jgi:2-polyprenyl-3-methyl-5-hydroxy-6-metoxy-1,4-benzoquinol methylase
MRNYNLEAVSMPDKKYNYDFDSIVRIYMMREWQPFFVEGSALEIGCYHGDSTLMLESFFSNLTVVEPSEECITIAKGRVGASVKFNCSTAEKFNENIKYDNIFIVNTLEHSDDSIAVLKAAKSLLKAGGRIFVLVPNADAPSRQIAVFMGLIDVKNSITEKEWQHGHRRTYSFDTLEKDIVSAQLMAIRRGGLIFKGLANYQMDLALEQNIISREYVEACYKLGMLYPSLCSSIYVVLVH